MQLKQILSLSQKHGLLLSSDPFKIGPIGSILMQNLNTEWLNSLVNNKEYPIFYDSDNFNDSYNFVKGLCSETLPFGIADTKSTQIEGNDVFSSLFSVSDYLRCNVFVAPTESMQFFHQWQRLRRMWWRKFSSTPGRYFTTDMQNNDGQHTVEIRAKYPWGEQLVEKLQMNESKQQSISEEQNECKFKNISVQSHHVSSEICKPVMFLNTVCDAYEELPFQDVKRVMFRFHRKLAPYKISFAVCNTYSSGVTIELYDLAQYLCKKLRTNNVSSLLLPKCTTDKLEQQYLQNDFIGVPYTVILNEGTLKNGVALLRSRDTTLKEQVHVSELPEYVDLLFKNY
ncbi:PREDICTED: DNA polymerase subunit gamma-2, mitochondrial [Nicrophorus vespilloides]|uniref:DNA polymerase subunit gamma-2, mitochondrial n=1 Tax=Nicrophorus vespilloides TaxID=110193 RepID=A0ABM1MNG5_NICVS|nr:PREDICTED: DNA polymerase subunit gamma-2, mitochondrial [Nicrophorus vespilloides]